MDGYPPVAFVRAGSESRALTGLRGLAALLVMAHHFKLHFGLADRLPVLGGLLQKGYLGVDLFFVLSGFVMAMTYGDWFDGHRPGWPAYIRFLVRRVARLWPLHAAMIGVWVAFGLALPRFPYSAHVLAANLMLIQAWGLSGAINPPAWSVSTELFAYLAFPALAWLALRGGRRAVFCAVAVAALYVAATQLGPPLEEGRRGPLDLYRNYSWLPVLRCVAGFALGMLAWRMGSRPRLRRLLSAPWAAPAILASASLLMWAGAYDLWVVPLLPALILATHLGRGPFYRALGHGPIHYLGLVSYAVYLVHLVLLVNIDRWATSLWLEMPIYLEMPVYLAATLLFATVLHAAIEVPGRSVMRGIGEALLDRLVPHHTSHPGH